MVGYEKGDHFAQKLMFHYAVTLNHGDHRLPLERRQKNDGLWLFRMRT